MKTAAFLSHLNSLHVRLSAEGERLRIRAPKGALTPDLHSELTKRKAEILALLQKSGGSLQPVFLSPLRAASRNAELPVSFAQQRLWLLNQLEPGSPAYNQLKVLRLEGTPDVEALKKALDGIVARHEVLRTTFTVVDGGTPVQLVGNNWSVDLRLVDLSEYPHVEQEAELQRQIDEIRERPFDLSRDLMLRATLLRLREQEHVLLLSTHHIAFDAWSIGVLFREFGALYEGFCTGKPSTLPELPIQYADYAVWQRQWLQGEILETQLAYWKNQLSDVPVLELPTDRPRPPVQSYRSAKQYLALSKALSDQLQDLSRKEGVTLFMTLLAAFQTLLHRYTGQDDIAVGSPIAGRTRPEIEPLIGFFVNTLVLRNDLSGNPTFRELLARVRKVAVDAYEHQDIPFEKLVEELNPDRDLYRTPLFQVMFVFQNAPTSAVELPGLAVTLVQANIGTVKFDLILSIIDESGASKACFEYNTDLFEEATIRRMLGHFQTLLEGVVKDADQPIADLPILTEAERHQLLVEWNDTQKDYPKDECIHEFFEAQVERSPGDVAVIFEDKQLTYQELNREANQLASYLKNLGVGYEALVGIYVERSLEMAVAVLAVLKAGGAYVPLDPLYPKERLAFMLEDSQVKVVLTQKSLVDALPTHSGQVVCLDTAWPTIARDKEDHVARAAIAENLAYVIYTSGSTGRPKAVAMPHGALSNLIAWQVHNLRRQETSRTLQFTSLSFDVSFQEIFTTWCSGGTLVIPSESVRQDVNSLLRFIADKKIDRIFLPFVALQQLAEASSGQNELAESLREIITAGEQLHVTPHIVGLFSQLRDCYVYNQYGPSESHVVSAFTLSDTAEGWPILPPIGRPIDNTEIYLLDHRHRPVPVGVPGELYIGGAGLARGYLNHPDLTAEKFIPNPFSTDPGARLYATGDLSRYLPDGNIEFLGRIDHQVKIRGYRVELGEIEAVLRQHPAVSTAVVITTGESPAEKRLVAYVVTNKVGALGAADLRKFLKDRLPDYMMPSFFVMLDEMPLTPSGKVNRRALPAPDQSRPELDETFVAPRTPIEQALAEIWAEILKLEQIGIHDNFFELGGHSLLATRLISRVRDAFQVDLALRMIFEAPTVAELALRIEQSISDAGELAEFASSLAEVDSLLDDEIERQLGEKTHS
jgi:amino acid adenylation domain-containing protein